MTASLTDRALAEGADAILKRALAGADDGELFLEASRGESFVWMTDG